jgi:hypothetical protein
VERVAPQPAQDAASIASGDPVVSAGADASVQSEARADLPLELPVTLSSPLTAGGMTLVAALLIGLLMAAPTAWTASISSFGLRPLSLAHSPPVPPG